MAGAALIEAIAERPEEARRAVETCMAEWLQENSPKEADSQVRRVAYRFALVAAAGKFAIACGILPWTKGTSGAAAATLLADRISACGAVEPAEFKAGLAQVRHFIEAYGEARFTPVEATPERVIPNRAGFRDTSPAGEREWLLFPEVWKTEVAAGHDPGGFARALAARGMMRADEGKPQVKCRLPGFASPVRVYVVTERLFGEGE